MTFIRFGPHLCKAEVQVFLSTRLSLGIVNLKPLLPGHVLLIPRRVVARMCDLTQDETSDLFLLATQVVGPRLEKHYGGNALTISIQDGVSAGQTVPHAHIHILPRTGPQDFNRHPDAIYSALEDDDVTPILRSEDMGNDSAPKEPWRKPRTEEQMQSEARILSKLFPEAEYQ
eukprot:Ihof_evm3s84 gene=Ihof_evmTU3s84